MSVTAAKTQPVYTLSEGVPLPDNTSSDQILTGSGGGYVLLSSTQLLETLAHFSRERIPERTVHAKASGAWGYYEVTEDVSDLTDADFLTGIGKKTELLTRISTVGPERGSADTVRDFRGYAIKIKTAEGNHDFVFNNQPVFFVRDPVKFPSLNRSHKRHPATNTASADMFWDFHVNNPESIHALMMLFGDRGIPYSLRHLNCFGGHTYTLTKSDGSYHYVRFHFITNQGVKNLTEEEAAKLAGTNPDFHATDLYNSIKTGDYPSWDVKIQVIHPDQVANAPLDLFDMTKVWPHDLYPLRTIGRMVLNRNPENYFTEIEQAAFSPSNMVSGIGPSPDPMLQARMFAYPDAARYRLGVNYQFLPTNAAKAPVYTPTQRDGFMNNSKNYGSDANYVGSKITPSRFNKTKPAAAKTNGVSHKAVRADEAQIGHPVSYTSEVTDADFVQSKQFWKMIGKQDCAQDRFIKALAGNVSGIEREWLRKEVYALFAKVDQDLGSRLEDATESTIQASQS